MGGDGCFRYHGYLLLYHQESVFGCAFLAIEAGDAWYRFV